MSDIAYVVLLSLSVPCGVLLSHMLDAGADRRALRLWVKCGGLGYPIANVSPPTAAEVTAGVDLSRHFLGRTAPGNVR